MIKNYFLVALRHLGRNRFTAAINIGGLAIGMAVAILIGLWVVDELSFDHGIPGHVRIAAVMQNQDISGSIQTWRGQAMQLAPVLRRDFPAEFKYVVTDAGMRTQLLVAGDKKIKVDGNYMEPQVIPMLGMRMVQGDARALDDPGSIILSVTGSKKIFGDADPMGRTVLLDGKNPVKVTGVYADLPENSAWQGLDYVCPFAQLVQTEDLNHRVGWGNSWFHVNVELNPGISMEQGSKAIRFVKRDNAPGDRRFRPELFLHPLDRWHLYSDFRNGVSAGGRIAYVRLYTVIGVIVLLLACINFMNLSTARSEKRAKEVGIRKTMGSMRGQLLRLFFSEALVVAFVSFLLAIAIAQLLLPFFSGVAGKQMRIPWGQPVFWLAGLCFCFLTGMLAGSYPALYLSSFRPVSVLRGTFKAGRLAALPRQTLVVVQFAVSVVLITGTLVILRQIQFVRDRPVGYERAGLLFVPRQNLDLQAHGAALEAALLETGLVESVAGSESSITNTYITNMGFNWRGKDPSLQEEFVTNGVTPTFGQTNGWQITDGRDFRKDYATDSNNIIINETAARYMGLAHPVGELVQWGDNGRFTIIGVVKDMISQSPYDRVPPMLFYLSSYLSFSRISSINIRLKPQAPVARSLEAMATVFRRFDPVDPFEYVFADQDFARKFDNEERVGRLAGFFTALAIFISCLGLLGLSAYVAEQREREVGIRKVLGASVWQLWHLLSREFLWLVAIALLAGGPVAGWIMHGWLGQYQYRSGLSWWIFAVTAGGAMALTLLTVSYQAIRTALRNPVKVLRRE